MRSSLRSTRAALAAALVAGACGRGGGDGQGGAAGKGGAGGREPVPVDVARATAKDVPTRLAAVGSVQAFETVSIRPLVTGAVVRVFFREGEAVRGGRPLFQIDPSPYQATLAQARGALERARQQTANAHADLARYANLVQKGYVTTQQYDTARATARALDADVAGSEAAVRRAELDLRNCRIASPIEGRTGAVLVQVGNVVQANQAGPLVVIARIRPISVAFAVPAASTAALRAGVGHMAVVADVAGGTREGTLAFVNNTVDPAAGTILAKATFPNEDEALWPGAYVDVHVVLGVRRGAVVAPAAAVVSGPQGPFVWVVKDDGTVEQRPVKVAQADAREAVLAAGLSPGEAVVTDGQLALVPGARVVARGGASGAAPGAGGGGAGGAPQAHDGGDAARVQGRRP
ncbi:MAG TPA: efflux RND transporter periplasmic adaptor subunit [Anaeromyxobacter sp.]